MMILSSIYSTKQTLALYILLAMLIAYFAYLTEYIAAGILFAATLVTVLISKLDGDIEFINRERLSKLTYAGHKKISRINRKTAIIAFSAEEVYAIAELIRRQKGGAAIVMGSLSPKTRNSQVELYQSGDVDFLVATDAIGMGINMDLDYVFFFKS